MVSYHCQMIGSSICRCVYGTDGCVYVESAHSLIGRYPSCDRTMRAMHAGILTITFITRAIWPTRHSIPCGLGSRSVYGLTEGVGNRSTP